MQEMEIIDCHTHIGVELFKYLRGEFAYCQDWDTLLGKMHRNGVTRSFVFPNVSYQAMKLPLLRESKVELGSPLDDVPYQRENERMMIEIYELFSESAGQAIPFANVDPLRKVPEQIRCLEKLRERYTFHGLKIQPTIIQAPILSLLKEGQPLLVFAREHDLPFLIHSSIAEHDNHAQAMDILKVAEKNPDIRFCLAHSARFHKPSLDLVRQLPNTWFDCSAHGIHCQCAVSDSGIVARKKDRFDADYSKPGQVLSDLAHAYPDELMWGTDSPSYTYVSSYGGHKTALWSTYEKEVEYLHEVPAPLRAKVATQNALAFLKQ